MRGKKWAGLKVQEKKVGEGRESRGGTGRDDGFSSFSVCQSSRVLAAGFQNALSDKSSFVTNARRFPSFPNLSVYGLLAHSRKLFFYWKEPRMWKGHEQGAPIGTGLPEQPAGALQGAGLPLEHQIAAPCSERHLKGHLRAFEPHLWKGPW